MQHIDDVIRNNIGLIKAQIKRLNLFNDPEAESLGYEALYNAIITYDTTKGYKLSTYATCCIYNALGSYIRTLNKKRQLEVLSYNNIAYCEDGVKHEFIELLTEDSDVEREYLTEELHVMTRRAFAHAYSRLSNAKHKAIIDVWREADFDISNKEVAIKVGVSQPYVNQVLNTFKYNMKKRLEAYYNG